jgi:hypothetical protein
MSGRAGAGHLPRRVSAASNELREFGHKVAEETGEIATSLRADPEDGVLAALA